MQQKISKLQRQSLEKIDGIVTAIMALDRVVRNQGGTGSLYDEREILVF